MDKDKRVSKKYSEDGGIDYHVSSSRDYLNSEIARQRRAKYIQAELAQYIPAGVKKILEFGAGYGQNLLYLPADEKIAYEPSAWVRDQSQYSEIHNVGDLASLEPDQFDAVISVHSLEHTLQPYKDLLEIFRLLRPGGKFLLVLPVERKLAYSPTDPIYHLFSWTPRTIGNLLTEVGFAIEQITTIYRAGVQKSAPLSNISPRFWLRFIRLYGFIRRVRDVIVVAAKLEAG